MNRLDHKRSLLVRRKARVRGKISGTAERPRLSVFVSNLHITAQAIDDVSGKTLLASDSKKLGTKGALTEKAIAVGTDIAKQAKAKKITTVVFDRNGKQYHGRVKALADAVRDGGITL